MKIEYEEQPDGSWTAEAPDIPGTQTDGESREEAISKVKVLALRVWADQLEKGNPPPSLDHVFRSYDPSSDRTILPGVRKRPGMFWGDSEHPFTSLVAFLSGYDIGRGRFNNLLPRDFLKFVTERFGHHYPHGGAGWMTFIEWNTSSEEEAFQLFFQLVDEYYQSHPEGEAPLPSGHSF